MDISNCIQTSIQIISVPLMIYIIYKDFRWTRRNLTRLQWSVPAMSWLLHKFIFYIYILLAKVFILPTSFFTLWSAVQSFHSLIVFAILIYTLDRLNGKVDHGC
jgi:hypothetical protein